MSKVSTALVRHLGYTRKRSWNAANQVILANLRVRVRQELIDEPFDKEEKAFNKQLKRVALLLHRIERDGPTGY